ncbi:MAG: aldehyde dehydrogenase family protein [Ilumatobacteraceae bacterium]
MSTDLSEQLKLVRGGADARVLHDLDMRRVQLERIERMLAEHEDEFVAALASDLGKSPVEAYSTEIGFTLTEIGHVLKHLKQWAKPRKVSLPLHLKPGSAVVQPEPLGTVLIIAPWNYPLQLVLAPLVAAIAAGNTAVVKPSEVAPATADALERLIPKYLDPNIVQVVTGGVDETTALLAEPWDHVFYTGNGTVGRIVMRAAAEHLTPVTLELGGKSPAVVTNNADLKVAARRIAWGKFTNAGQTCVAPDYVLVDRSVASGLLAELSNAITTFYGDDPQQSDDYGRIVNDKHFARVTGLLDGAGTIAHGGSSDAADLHRTDDRHRRRPDGAADAGRDLRPHPPGHHVRDARRGDPIRDRASEAAGVLPVHRRRRRSRRTDRPHDVGRRHGQPHPPPPRRPRTALRRCRGIRDGRLPRPQRVRPVLAPQADPAPQVEPRPEPRLPAVHGLQGQAPAQAALTETGRRSPVDPSNRVVRSGMLVP